jgi:hypothetical protein
MKFNNGFIVCIFNWFCSFSQKIYKTHRCKGETVSKIAQQYHLKPMLSMILTQARKGIKLKRPFNL